MVRFDNTEGIMAVYNIDELLSTFSEITETVSVTQRGFFFRFNPPTKYNKNFRLSILTNAAPINDSLFKLVFEGNYENCISYLKAYGKAE